jgi:hypothetical protein
MTFPTPTGNASDPIYAQLAATPTGGYFVVPEGELGQITNALATVAHANDPRDLVSLGGLRKAVDDTVESLKQTVGLATGSNTSWTVTHATSAVQVLAMEGAGYKRYSTIGAAQSQATNQNRNVSGSGAPSNPLTSYLQFLKILTDKNVWIRIGEFTLGSALIIVGLAHLMGEDSAAFKLATKAALL